MKKYYTYLHFRADCIEQGPFYVGKGQRSRAWSTKSRSLHWRRIVKKHGLHVEICADLMTEEEAYQHEIALIAEWRHKGVSLINLTDGGEGLKNPAHEVREKISCAAKSQWQDSSRRELLLAARRREDSRRAQSDGIRRALAKPEVREKLSVNGKAGKNTPEAIAKRKALCESVEYREKLSQGVKKAHERPEVRANKSAASSRRWESDEYKANFAAKMRELTEKRWEVQGIPEEERARRRRKAENRLRILSGAAPMTKAEASALGHAAKRNRRES